MKKLLCVVLSGIMAFSTFAVAVPITASAAESQESVSATYGDFEYTLEDDYTCTITGYKGSAANVTIPSTICGNKVSAIGSGAFRGCNNLIQVTILDSVTHIGNMAFYDCDSLSKITIPNSVTYIGDLAFCGCGSLDKITIPNSVTSIGVAAFEDCRNLTKITIPDSVTSIESRTFRFCMRLNEITIPSSVKIVHGAAFMACSSLKKITIPNSVTSIGESAFCDCDSLSEITIPDCVTYIGSNAFSGIGITNIVIPDSVTNLEGGAFYNCQKLKSVKLPKTLEVISDSLFSQCYELENVNIPNTVTKIDTQAFQDCKKLSKVNLPSSLKEIGIYAFNGCKNLTNISIPNNLKIVGAMAFCDCNLSQINLPKSVTEIQEYALGYNDLYPDSKLFEPLKIKNFKIYGYKNTAAETYAKENGFNFIENSAATSVSLNKTSLTLDVGKSYTLTKTVSPSNAVTSYTWSSSNTSVATVDKNGKVTAKASGTATITVKTSNGKTANCKVTVNLPTPQITSLSNTTGGIKISWNKVDGAYGYRLYYKPASGGWKRFKDTTATSFTDSGVSPNRTETYTIRCIDKNGNTISGFNSNGWSKKYTPVAPTISELENTSGGIKISWNKIAGVYGYRLYYKTSSGGWKRFKDTTATSFTDSGVSPNRTETYTIRCIDKNGNTISGFNSNGWSKKYTPVAPTISELENTSGGIKISWNKIAGVYGYRLYYKTSSGGWKRFKDTTATSFTDSGVSPNRTETYTIRCIDKNGKTVSGFNSKGWSKKYTPVAPTITRLSNTSKGVSVTWNKIAGVYGYRLYRKYNGGSWTKVKDTTSTSFTDSGAKKGKKVTYTVRCIDRKGKTVSGFNSKGWSITRK